LREKAQGQTDDATVYSEKLGLLETTGEAEKGRYCKNHVELGCTSIPHDFCNKALATLYRALKNQTSVCFFHV
jgi:hypothetical protein